MTVFTPTRQRLDPIRRLFWSKDTTIARPPMPPASPQTSGELDEQTSADVIAWFDDALARLELVANHLAPDDVAAFVTAYQEIDWDGREAGEFVQAARLALRVGAHLIARECALTGVERFPEHPELQKMARILDPPKARVIKSKPNTSWQYNKAWLQAHWHEYIGRWVALKNGELFAVADSFNELVAQTGDLKGKDILVTLVE
ncbi:MAG: hypothetical protein ACE5FD_10800 [Anaerolineae bacterium]